MLSSLRAAAIAWLALLSIVVVSAQSIGFVDYPTQVITGRSYPVSWAANGQAVTINLLQGGQVVETLHSGIGSTFTWEVEDDDGGGIDYALQLVPQANLAATINTGAIWVIEDEDGLNVNGQLVFSSVANGPAVSGLAASAAVSTAASAASSSVGAANTPAVMSDSAAGPITETVTFSSAQEMYTFTTTVSGDPTGTDIPTGPETLTFVSAGLTFTTTIAVPTASATETDTAAGSGGAGISGGAIAGIVIGVSAILAIILGFLWFRRRQHKRKASQNDAIESPVIAFIKGGKRALGDRKSGAAGGAVTTSTTANREDEKFASNQDSIISPMSLNSHEMEGGTVPAQHTGPTFRSSEMDGTTARHEMNGAPPIYEIAAEDVGPARGSNTRYPATCVSV